MHANPTIIPECLGTLPGAGPADRSTFPQRLGTATPAEGRKTSTRLARAARMRALSEQAKAENARRRNLHGVERKWRDLALKRAERENESLRRAVAEERKAAEAMARELDAHRSANWRFQFQRGEFYNRAVLERVFGKAGTGVGVDLDQLLDRLGLSKTAWRNVVTGDEILDAVGRLNARAEQARRDEQANRAIKNAGRSKPSAAGNGLPNAPKPRPVMVVPCAPSRQPERARPTASAAPAPAVGTTATAGGVRG